MTVKGDFGADINTADLKKLSVSGAMIGSLVRATNSIGAVTAATMAGSTIFAGISDTVTSLPSSANAFASPTAFIKGVSVKSKAAGAFSDTLIAGGVVGAVKLGAVDVDNANDKFGVAAMLAKSVAGTTPSGKLSLKGLNDPAQSTSEDDFEVRVF